MVKTRSIATKVALVVSAVVIGALALTGWSALKRSDAELVRLQLSQASTRLTTNLGIAQRIFDERFPGPWQLAPGTPLTFSAGPAAPAFQADQLVDQERIVRQLDLAGVKH